MLHVRVVKTKGQSRSVQVIRYQNGRRVIVKHIGSATTNEEIDALIEIARSYMDDITRQSSLFPNMEGQDTTLLFSSPSKKSILRV